MRDLTLLGDPLRREITGDPEVFPLLDGPLRRSCAVDPRVNPFLEALKRGGYGRV